MNAENSNSAHIETNIFLIEKRRIQAQSVVDFNLCDVTETYLNLYNAQLKRLGNGQSTTTY